MKRITILLMSSLLLFTMWGCQKDNPATVEGTTQQIEEIEIASADNTSDLEKKEAFHYIHDPRRNEAAMKDIVENPNAVYGFSPNPDSPRLGIYADYDWTDPDLVAEAKANRIAYHQSFSTMYDILHTMRDEGKSIEEMARAVNAERNRLRLESYKDDPEGLAKVKQSNLDTYGDENGPTADSLYEKYGSWEMVIQKAFSTNPGMDACCGLYDDQYDLYVELGLVTEE